jgi:hypothetical protein
MFAYITHTNIVQIKFAVVCYFSVSSAGALGLESGVLLVDGGKATVKY